MMKKNSLENLVERATRNDEGAFEELYRKYYKSVYLAAFKLCKSDADAQDITQLTFIKVRASIHTLQQPDYFPLWVNRICINVAKNFFRRNRDVLFNDEYFQFHNQAIETRADFVPQEYWRRENDVEILAKLIQELKLEHRKILELFYFQHKSYEVISKQLNMPVGTVKSRLYYARNEVKKKINTYEKVEDVKLNFKEEALGAAIMVLYLTKQTSMIPKIGYFSFLQRMTSNLSKSIAIKTTVAASFCVVNVIAIGYAGQVYDRTKETDESNKTQMEPVTNSLFNAHIVDEYTIQNEVDAYYLLMNWGFDKQSLDKKSKEDILLMMPLYEEITKQNGQLYHVLKEANWSSYYEELLKK